MGLRLCGRHRKLAESNQGIQGSRCSKTAEGPPDCNRYQSSPWHAEFHCDRWVALITAGQSLGNGFTISLHVAWKNLRWNQSSLRNLIKIGPLWLWPELWQMAKPPMHAPSGRTNWQCPATCMSDLINGWSKIATTSSHGCGLLKTSVWKDCFKCLKMFQVPFESNVAIEILSNSAGAHRIF